MVAKELHGELNPAFVLEVHPGPKDDGVTNRANADEKTVQSEDTESRDDTPKRDQWGKGLEFLMSCIAMSVGLGNIWRFPFIAYENGGGAFLIPYIIVLILVGKPLYFMEMVLGQFSSKGSVKVYDFVPAMRGSGAGQTVAVACVMTYYASLMSIIIYYLFASFSSVLPWTVCEESWKNCYPSGEDLSINETMGLESSSELYFLKTVLRQLPNIDDGIGTPEWKLILCLLAAWLSVFLVLLRGVKSSGKAAYFLAIFPYIVMFVLLIRAVTLPGAKNGIIYFIEPDFDKLLDPSVWYAAVTQCFFSLSVCFGNVIMYSSYNNFRHNIYRDAMIVTSLDTVTSLLAGFTIFGILGNLAQESGKEIPDVVQSGWALAFVSYPEAISKFKAVPQLFSVLFFLMLFVLGIGSNVAMASSIITVVRDKFPHVKHWHAVIAVAIFGFSIGLVYITPGGMFILNLVDHHGGSFIVYILGIGQICAVSWIYGMRRFCNDIEFMLNMKPSLYWRICWAIVTPAILIIVLLYSLIAMKPLEYNKVAYPVAAIVCGWLLSAFGILQLPTFAGLAFYKRRLLGIPEMFKAAYRPRESWGPVESQAKKEWISFTERKNKDMEQRQRPIWRRIFDKILGY
ncbi:sodium-dependent nutrient amino acid transporter 1-like [Arctopsyche grandis]|uniref:sodium-dependent nutrient amino acid transporter 1-like n=1 Tax=Arctopsyche grandis TaxID=121162 RepID=UPI00406D7217